MEAYKWRKLVFPRHKVKHSTSQFIIQSSSITVYLTFLLTYTAMSLPRFLALHRRLQEYPVKYGASSLSVNYVTVRSIRSKLCSPDSHSVLISSLFFTLLALMRSKDKVFRGNILVFSGIPS